MLANISPTDKLFFLKTETPSLKDSENRFRLVVEASPNGIVVADQSGNIVMVNARAETLFGYSRGEFLELKVEDLIPKNIRPHHQTLRKEYSHHPEVRSMGAGRDLYALRKDGSEFPVEIGLNPLQIDDSNFVLSSVVDITERKKAEEKLQQLTIKLQFQAEILKNVHDAVFFVNEEGVIQDWNEGAARIFQCAAEEAIGSSLLDLCPHTGGHPFETRIKPAVESKGVVQEILRCALRSGEEIFIQVRVTRMTRADQSGYVFCASDITDRKRLETELLKVAEEEQRKIGQDLHDDLCSQLSGIGCLTKVLEQQLKTENASEAEMISNISEMIANAGVKAREIAYGLAPSVLENQGLEDALRDLGKRTRILFGVTCTIHTPGIDQLVAQLDANTTVQIYRIAQESITNAAKHSGAELIELILTSENGRLELLVRDNGKGMSVDLVTAGMGLITMQRRAELIQADFTIEASPGKGTSVRSSVPLL